MEEEEEEKDEEKLDVEEEVVIGQVNEAEEGDWRGSRYKRKNRIWVLVTKMPARDVELIMLCLSTCLDDELYAENHSSLPKLVTTSTLEQLEHKNTGMTLYVVHLDWKIGRRQNRL